VHIDNREAIRGLELLRYCLFITGLFLICGCEPLPATDSLKEVPGAYWKWMQQMAEQHASYLLLAIAILPGFGFPVSPLLVLSGALSAKTGSVLTAWFLTAVAMWVNAAWTYLFASGPGRAITQKFLNKFIKKGLHVPEAQGYQLALILRVTPGVPLPFQNYFLGVSGVSAKVYWIVTLPVQGAWALGFVVFGDGLLQGNSKLIITGVGLLVVLMVIARMLTKKFNKKNKETPVES
jgi:uncharacterized membrane protein YdjX (TVP38/TMEM64 family)